MNFKSAFGVLLRLFLFLSLICAPVSLEIAVPFGTGYACADDSHEGSSTDRRRRRRERRRREEEVQQEPAQEDTSASDLFQETPGDWAPIDTVIVIDASRSMKRSDPKRLREQGAKLFYSFLSKEDRVAIVEFDRGAKVLLELVPASPSNRERIDTAIEKISDEGGFTDIYAGMETARLLLEKQGRAKSTRAIVLLSDGKMDPHPSRGDGAFVSKKLFEIEIPALRRNSVKTYTLSLSDEADSRLLSKIAKQTDALHWFTDSAHSIHNKFSELFLSLKKPQIIPLKGREFEIDPSSQEATFFISRSEEDEDIVFVDPMLRKISNKNLPQGLRWFRGSLFDMVTIEKPMPGRWMVQGVESPKGFATVLTDITLQVYWPKTNFQVGEKFSIVSRLTEKGKAFSAPDMEKITFFSYKVISVADAEVIYSGNLNDEGLDGDKSPGDKIYSQTLSLDKAGDYKALVAVTTPTYTRQRHISFSVSLGAMSLQAAEIFDEKAQIDPNEILLASSPERVFLVHHLAKMGVEKYDLKVLAEDVDSAKQHEIVLLKKETTDPLVEAFQLKLGELPEGHYSIRASAKGRDKMDLAFQTKSNLLKYLINRSGPGSPSEGEIGAREEDVSYYLSGVLSLGLSFLWFIGICFYSVRRSKTMSASIADRPEYKIPADYKKKLTEYREISSKDLDDSDVEDLKLREIIEAVFPVEEAEEGENTDSPPRDDKDEGGKE